MSSPHSLPSETWLRSTRKNQKREKKCLSSERKKKQSGSDWLGTLSEDLCQEDDCGVLAIVLGRAKVPLFAPAVVRRVENCAGLAPANRAAYYHLLECLSVKPFAIVERILSREMSLWNPHQTLLLWPVFRACCKLVESASFAVAETRQFDVGFNFLVFVLCEPAMNIVCRVHAALALRALVEWQRVDNAGHVVARLVWECAVFMCVC
jgi:hypothetical protein